MQCQVEEIVFEPDRAEQCGSVSIAECFDCGTELCHQHAIECPTCKRVFCGYCIAEHDHALAA